MRNVFPDGPGGRLGHEVPPPPGGPFLDGSHLGDTPEFERWVDGERARLADLFAQTAETEAVQASARGDHARAVALWRRLVAADALNSRVALGLMNALASAGDRAGALRHARLHQALLRQEFDAAPGEDVIALAERLRTESRYTPSVIRTTPRPPEEPAAEQTEATQEEATQDETPEDATPERLVPDRKMRTAPTDADRAQPIRLSGLRVDTRVVVAVAAILAVAATLVVVAAALAFWARQATPRLDPRRVLVAGFENRSGEDSLNLVGDIAADWLAQGLLHTGLVNVVDSRTALLAGQSVAVEAMPLRGVARVRALAEQTGAGTVVWGSFYRQGDTLQFDVEVTAANSGQLLRAIDPVRAPLAGRTQAIELMR